MNAVFDILKALLDPPGLVKSHIEHVLGIELTRDGDNPHWDRFQCFPPGTLFLAITFQAPSTGATSQERGLTLALRPETAPLQTDVENVYGLPLGISVKVIHKTADRLVWCAYKAASGRITFEYVAPPGVNWTGVRLHAVSLAV